VTAEDASVDMPLACFLLLH